ncbi:hypothetical protein Nepgr_025366 [Nepenthes gracilis]|uniref:Uncharacterized protein n=1 Tax=Nepenthes gracilis TaxID=150966 RepID=A0AAD3T4L6_NEPGR|nr:hypothetical protein Nepgr_025366 [Nepenthes gracilis]
MLAWHYWVQLIPLRWGFLLWRCSSEETYGKWLFCNCLGVRVGLLCSADAGLDVVRVLLLLSYSMLMLSYWCNVMDDSQNASCPLLLVLDGHF